MTSGASRTSPTATSPGPATPGRLTRAGQVPSGRRSRIGHAVGAAASAEGPRKEVLAGRGGPCVRDPCDHAATSRILASPRRCRPDPGRCWWPRLPLRASAGAGAAARPAADPRRGGDRSPGPYAARDGELVARADGRLVASRAPATPSWRPRTGPASRCASTRPARGWFSHGGVRGMQSRIVARGATAPRRPPSAQRLFLRTSPRMTQSHERQLGILQAAHAPIGGRRSLERRWEILRRFGGDSRAS